LPIEAVLSFGSLDDLHKDGPAAAHLRTAEQLAGETNQAEIAAWCLETQAWQVLTAGGYRRAAEIAGCAACRATRRPPLPGTPPCPGCPRHVRHNLRMPIQRWRSPAVLRVKSFLAAALGVTIALVFLPLWFAVPVAAVLGAWGLGMAALGGSVIVDEEAGLLSLRMGLLTRRVRLTDITAVLVDQSKVSIGRARGGEISLYTWRKDRLDALLGVPMAAGDIGHAISRSSALAQKDQAAPGTAQPAGRVRTPARTRSRLATALLAAAGVAAIAGALFVRVRWDSPVLTVLGVIIALVLGLSGLLYLVVALWILLTGRAPRFTAVP
jgi:hypothetical protein